jgi:hypothetical protein
MGREHLVHFESDFVGIFFFPTLKMLFLYLLTIFTSSL